MTRNGLPLIAAALFATPIVHGEIICSGRSLSVAVDLRTGVRVTDGAAETFVYDAAWYSGGASVRIDGMGTAPVTGTAGTATWTPILCRHHLALDAFDASGNRVGTESADFILPGGLHDWSEDSPAVAPTCTEAGRTAAFTCSRCGEVVASQVISPLGHFGVITKPEVEPAFGVEGLTAEISCARCGEILQAQRAVDALEPVRNVTARQLWPHKKVEVCFDVGSGIADAAGTNDAFVLACSYGGITNVSSRIFGDTSLTPGHHVLAWDLEADGIAIDSTNVTFSVGVGTESADSVTGVPIGTSFALHDGMNVSGAMELGYSPFEGGEATIRIDGETAVSAAESGVFLWQPQTVGLHTLQHVSGTNTWTRTVSVTSLAFDEGEGPNPPTEADENIAISSTSRHFAKGGGSSSIVTSGSGTWTASPSVPWITIPAALSSRNAGLPVVYQVAASDRAEPRTGYVYVSGHVFTVTQDGVGATLDSYSADFGSAGGTGSFTVLAGAQIGWQARSNVDWISVGTTSGTGEAAVSFTVAPLHSVATRTGTITAAGCTFTVNQTGRRLALSATDASYTALGLTADRDYAAHVVAIVVTAAADTTWDVEVDASWLSVADAGSGRGGGTVAVAANENPSWLARTGRVRIGTETLVVRQAGRPAGAGTLSFAISPAETTASVKGANGLIAVMATPDLPWSAESRANWLTVMPGARSGAGNGNVVYAASPNPMLSERTGAIEVAPVEESALPAQTHAVTQPAAVAEISATAHAFAAAGESFGVEVSCDDVVQWTVEEACDWLSVAGSTNRVGSGTAVLEAAANPTVDARSATVTIAGHVFAVTQRGRSVEVEYGARVFEPEGGYDAVEVHPDGNVTWKAVSSAPEWLTIWGGENCTYDEAGNVIGTGDDTIEYIVSEYVGDGTPRTATITIGDKAVYVTQRAYDLTISPSAAQVGGNAGAGQIGVSASVGDIWNAIAAEPWITIVSGYDAGSGSGTVRFSYTDNNTGETRTGRIIVAGEEYTLTQAARQLVSVSARVASDSPIPGAVPGTVSGTGRYDRGTYATLRATPSDGYAFVNWTLPNGSTRTGATLSVTANVDQEIVANFHRLPVVYVNGEGVYEGTRKTFTAPADILDAAGTTKLVCLGTSRFPEKGRSFTLVVTEDIVFEWDLWQTNYLVSVTQTTGGTIQRNGSTAANFWAAVGSTVDLAATPASGKTLFRWTGSVADELNAARSASAPDQASFVADAPATVSALFGVFDDTLAEALDAPALAFTTGGDADWAPVVDATAQTGYTSARSGAGGADTDTWLDLSLEGSGTLSFRWRTDCEKDDGGGATWDRLAVFVNGVEFSRIDGTTDWQTVTIPVTGPKTTIRWSFYRDDWDDPGPPREHAGWIDGVTFTTEGL